jgi:DNA-binding CsgD family transcriptional regulator
MSAGERRPSIPTGDLRSAGGSVLLTPREEAILRLIAAGHGNKSIGPLLRISHFTVDSHLRRMLQKARVHSRAALIARVR